MLLLQKKKPKEEMTIDHVYPADFGGPTITNNLLPSCKGCNNKKRNMLYNESLYKYRIHSAVT